MFLSGMRPTYYLGKVKFATDTPIFAILRYSFCALFVENLLKTQTLNTAVEKLLLSSAGRTNPFGRLRRRNGTEKLAGEIFCGVRYHYFGSDYGFYCS